MLTKNSRVKVADQVWVAVALLHRQHPESVGFTAEEIVERVRQEFHQVQPGIRTHLYQHAVAIRPPNPGRYRMLHQLEDGKLRLFRPGDPYHLDREGSKTYPIKEDIPAEYHHLLRWYEYQYVPSFAEFTLDHPLFKLMGAFSSGRSDISENHDKYLAEIYYAEAHP